MVLRQLVFLNCARKCRCWLSKLLQHALGREMRTGGCSYLDEDELCMRRIPSLVQYWLLTYSARAEKVCRNRVS